MSTIQKFSRYAICGCTGVLFSLAACGAPVEDANDETRAEGESASVEIARFQLAEGRQGRFLAIDDGVLFEETGPESVEPFVSTTDDLSALDIFLSLAPSDTPIPKAIAALAEGPQKQAIVGRAVVDSLPGSRDIAAPTSELRLQGHSGQTGAYGCAGGAAAFEAFACDGSGTSNEFCDSGQWFNLARNSGSSRVKRSLGVFVACGTHVQITHQYRDCCSGWRDLHTSFIPGGFWMSSRYTGLAKWRRRMTYDRVYQPSGSYLRAYSAFY